MKKSQATKDSGFTLIEMAIVLVIIGLILGGVMKGKTLIDSSKVNSESARLDRISAGFNIFFERYGRYPGDGCNNSTCSNNGSGAKDGIINTSSQEEGAAWYELIQKSKILKVNDRTSIFGRQYRLRSYNFGGGEETIVTPNDVTAKKSYACQLDRIKDDGNSQTGNIISAGGGGSYDLTSDCWGLSGNDVNPFFKLDY